MATAEEFRWAARAVFAESDEIGQVGQRVKAERGKVDMEGGAVVKIVDAAISAIVNQIRSMSDSCRDIADELLERALCCDQYTADLLKWLEEKRNYDELVRNHATPFVPLRPKPQPPHAWCEATI